MFEKEAEELFKKKPLGYEMKPELEIYKDGFNDGYNKANEWHYVKDGDYPEHRVPVICILGNIKGKDYAIGYYDKYDIYDKNWHCENENYPDNSEYYGVTAWKEIVPPEEIKENDKS